MKIEAGKILRPFSLASEFMDEIAAELTNDGLRILQPDRMMVVVVDFLIKKGAYESNEKDAKTFAVNSGALVDILKRFGNDTKLDFVVTPEELRISGGSRKFKQLQASFKPEKPPLEKLEFDAKFGIPMEQLRESIEDAKLAGEAVFFESDGTGLVIEAKGEGTDVEGDYKGVTITDFVEGRKYKSLYPLGYLGKLLKHLKGFEDAVVEFKTDYPCRITAENDDYKFVFILAPRVE